MSQYDSNTVSDSVMKGEGFLFELEEMFGLFFPFCYLNISIHLQFSL